ncbi:MAG: hypothetical protein ACLP50_13040 [Solirubrobacteraceae bacterium]
MPLNRWLLNQGHIAKQVVDKCNDTLGVARGDLLERVGGARPEDLVLGEQAANRSVILPASPITVSTTSATWPSERGSPPLKRSATLIQADPGAVRKGWHRHRKY